MRDIRKKIYLFPSRLHRTLCEEMGSIAPCHPCHPCLSFFLHLFAFYHFFPALPKGAISLSGSQDAQNQLQDIEGWWLPPQQTRKEVQKWEAFSSRIPVFTSPANKASRTSRTSSQQNQKRTAGWEVSLVSFAN